jgi:nucleoside-diphosphate-sugar epimerase
MKVAVTGATGYTGGRLVTALLARGDDVRALARSASVTPGLRSSGAQVVEGDLRDAASLRRLCEGADAVIHVAAVYRTVGHTESYYRDINVGGTERLLEAAAAAGLRRFVHTSTVGVHGHVISPPADESTPLAPGDVYQVTKAEADTLALEFGPRHGLPVTVVRPGAIYGPGETRLLKLFRAIARGRYAIVGTGRPFYHPVYIDDLVRGFLLALDRPGAAGEAFIIAGPRYVTQAELAALIARHSGGRVLPLRIPATPVVWAGILCEALCAPLGIEPPLHRRRVEFWTKSRAFSIEKARRLLGYVPQVDLDEGIERTVAWYRDAGWL